MSNNPKKEKAGKVLAVNRKARHLYEIIESLECGIALQGTEVKSLKDNQFSFVDSYVKIENDELWLMALHITPYKFGNIFNHEPDRKRRLLAHKNEIIKLRRKVDAKGLTLIPIQFYIKDSKIKIEVALCKGKKLYDKRDDIKKRDLRRDTDRELRQRY
jgi:SsrA-binding protein